MSIECVFCDDRELAERVVAGNQFATAFLSSPRLTEGHVLVIPRRHVELPSELMAEELMAIFDLISPIHVKLLGSIATGVDIWQKTRPEVEQDGHKIDHVHFHIIPSVAGEERYSEALNWRRTQFSKLETGERDRVLTLLRPENKSQ